MEFLARSRIISKTRTRVLRAYPVHLGWGRLRLRGLLISLRSFVTLRLSLVCTFKFIEYLKGYILTILKGAVVADSYLGKVRTIIYFSVVYMLGLLILFLTSLPIAIESGYTYSGLLTAMVLIGVFVMVYIGLNLC
jgi:hypothetical protein